MVVVMVVVVIAVVGGRRNYNILGFQIFNTFSNSYKVLNTDNGMGELSFGAFASQHQCLFWDVIGSLIPAPVAEP